MASEGRYFGVPNPAPPKFEVDGCPNVVTLPNETRLFSFGEGFGSRAIASLANGDDRSGEYDCNKLDPRRDIHEDDWEDIVSHQEDFP